jgi:hypothetical protein
MGSHKRPDDVTQKEAVDRQESDWESEAQVAPGERFYDLCGECRNYDEEINSERPIVSESKPPQLGTLPRDGDLRDAVHMAVVPVIAAQRLQPGQHVGRHDDSRYGASDHPVGIVDPFLLVAVAPDQLFWLMMYPGTVMNLRHAWKYPGIPDE